MFGFEAQPVWPSVKSSGLGWPGVVLGALSKSAVNFHNEEANVWSFFFFEIFYRCVLLTDDGRRSVISCRFGAEREVVEETFMVMGVVVVPCG